MKSKYSNVRIVLIDKGSLAFLKRDDVLFRYNLSDKFDIREQIYDDSSFSLNHGDICAAIIKKYYDMTSIGIIDIFRSNNNLSSSKKLIKALEYCTDLDVDIVHLSIGSTRYKDFYAIRNVISRLCNAGKIIISAGSNENTFAVPASLAGVIGVVKTDTVENDQTLYNYYNYNKIDFKAKGQHRLFKKFVTDNSNSFAAPVVTAKACKIISKNPDYRFCDIYQKLVSSSINYKTGQKIWIPKYDCCERQNNKGADKFKRNCCNITDLKAPVIIMYNLTNEILLELKNEFLLSDYNCLAVSNIIHSDYLEIEYIKTKNIYLAYKKLLAISTAYAPDLVLLNLDGYSAVDFSEYFKADYILDISKTLKLTVNNRKYDIKKLYNKLLAMLGGNKYEEKNI